MNSNDQSIAIVRAVPSTYPQASVTFMNREAISLELARHQHQAYVTVLEQSGYRIVMLPADDRFPDSCFVEDTAVILGDAAIISNMGAPTRNGEQARVVDCLSQTLEVVRMEPPACLEGGDVLKVRGQLFVGESGRTNRLGFEFLRNIAAPRGYAVTSIPVRGALHLKSVISYLGSGTYLATAPLRSTIQRLLEKCEVIEVAEADAYAANVLSLGRTVMMARGFPSVAQLIADCGFSVKELDLSEFRKREGGPTCLSLVLSDAATRSSAN